MAVISEFKVLFDEWITAVTGALDGVASHVVSARRILLNEDDDGAFRGKMISTRTVPAKSGPALPDLLFRLENGRPHPPLPADWQAAFRGSRVELQ